ncbi:DNA-directed RNA polymerase subunit beta [Candidatus Uabimicrobium amorphum]|uniref:DNA-directed RNA polymerase subunit beta n=1 Tax=Uabimicrobium amorphum TaxID=2596890 RepID=A0A5S9IPM1_UABAM|nr:DNA-directed RNA polymerase subunit beta [Candidatus Uabimicrobium amorphum]BBM85574.1 DNA-directed RNA polymerase subunit beta [Candidatus Uabimicrobium amorphum]
MKVSPKKKHYGRYKEVIEVPNLIELQLRAYEDFLQMEAPFIDREDKGLEAIIRKVFPIKSYDGKMSLEYLYYELGKPRYNPDECRKLKLTYGAPFTIRVRLNIEGRDPIEDDVYLGEIPIMIGGGEFIINGAERVIVSQLHRSPGIDFAEEKHSSEKHLQTCWIIPERGSWIEINVTKKETLVIRIDQSGKIPITIFIRAMGPEYSTDESIIKLFYETQTISLRSSKASKELAQRILASSIQINDAVEQDKLLQVPAGTSLTDDLIKKICDSDLKSVTVLKEKKNRIDNLILKTLEEDPTSDLKRNKEKEPEGYVAALARIFARLRPGTPFNLERAKNLFFEKFHDPTRYRLGPVGRFRLNRKFGQKVNPQEMVLTPEDIFNSVNYILKLRKNEGEVDDIDHLGNRRVRTIVELAGDEFYKGFLKLNRTIKERMNIEAEETLSPKNLINSKTISSAVDYFFGRGELSQVVDQTNPLAQLTHERRLSALGPGGLNRKRAGFEVRDVHISHYGRICPIETPEGTNIGLISSLAIYTTIDEYGFLVSPYLVAKNGKVTQEIKYLRADEEHNKVIAPADSVDSKGNFYNRFVIARVNGDYQHISNKKVDYCDISPKQMVGVSASLIPFLEHNDANRALMGSNMQRQAVPLLVTEAPIVSTGMEKAVAQNSSMVICSEIDGKVKSATAERIIVEDKKQEIEYKLRKFVGLNERTCLNQKPIVRAGDKVKKNQVIADGAATDQGQLALGRNVLVAFMPWDGYNFEDAIIVSEKLVKEDYYTSIHIDEFEAEIRETKLGKEEFTRDIPNVSERALLNLDDDGIVKVGTIVRQGDILVGKVAPKNKSELSPEEKLLHAIFGRAGEDVKNDSLEVPSGVEGIVIHTQKFARKLKSKDAAEATKNKAELDKIEQLHLETFENTLRDLSKELVSVFGDNVLTEKITWPKNPTLKSLKDVKEKLNINRLKLSSREKRVEAAQIIKQHMDIIMESEDQKNKQSTLLQSGDELPPGVLELVKVYIATKRILSVGDKMAGRHGNKGVISKILPEEDMPFLEDGTPVEIILNPLGVPSRMNVGQILETHLGWAAKKLNFQAITPIFDGCSEKQVEEALEEAGLPKNGTCYLYDGRTGERFDQKTTVGYIYMLKLHHLVDDKVHARATGPYSLITQQPLGGKARFGGQRFGEMEVWALEAYGVANILQELLTVKSDDVEGRTKIYESMVKGENTLEPGTPISFEVLTNEIKGLALDMQLHKKKVKKRPSGKNTTS